MHNLRNFSFGADVELWAVTDKHVSYNPKRHDIVPAYYALGGDVSYNLPYGRLFPDGAALEFTVTPSTLEQLTQRIDANIFAISELIRMRGYLLDDISFGYVGIEKIHSVPMEGTSLNPTDRDRRVCMTILGCSPDMNVYGRLIRRPDPKKFPWRSIGGHIHIGLPPEFLNYELFEALVSLLDLNLKPIFDKYFTRNDRERTRLYGVYGTFRAKIYGVEYRSIPSRFLTNPELRNIVFTCVENACQTLIRRGRNNTRYEEIVGAKKEEVEYELFKCS